jgi:transposase
MKSRRIVEHFIELRALGKSYDEIVKKTGVSKPTLIKWGNTYKEEIEEAKHLLTKKLAEKIAVRNSELINGIAENLKRAMMSETSSVEVKEKFVKKSYRKLGDIFKVKVKDIELTINKEGDVVGVYISCE